MKNIIKIFFALYVLLISNASAQQMVQTTSEIYKLRDNRDHFINKPLKDLLKEIKPEIKTAHVFNNENSSLLLLRFTTIEQQKRKEGSLADRTSLLIYLKDYISWDWESRPRGRELDWTQNDPEKFGNSIISNIEIVEKK